MMDKKRIVDAYGQLHCPIPAAMPSDRFLELVKEIREASLDTLIAKDAKYGTEDKLHNFRVGAALIGGTPAQAAWGYMTKHLVALRDMVQSNDFSDRADLMEKVQDCINYLCFIWVIGNEEATK